MNAPEANPPPQQVMRAPDIRENPVPLLWRCAVESFTQAILITVLGTIAVGMVGAIWGEMTPSLPPGFAQPKAAPEAGATASWNFWSYFQQHRFAIIFFTLFVLKIWSGFFTLGRTVPEPTAPPTRRSRIGRRFARDWFGLIVGNAFGALISAIILNWVQQFSVWYWVREWFLSSVLGGIHNLAVSLFGGQGVNAFGAWFGWYGANRLKLAFWVFYLAAICDDLGIPNLKTLGRWSWRRWLRHRRPAERYG